MKQLTRNMSLSWSRFKFMGILALTLGLVVNGCTSSTAGPGASRQGQMGNAEGGGHGMSGSPQAHAASKEKMVQELQKLAPYRGYLKAHQDVQRPLGLLGGPIKVSVRQESGGVHVAFPDNRKLDPNVFGNPKWPRAFGGTPGINGVPPMQRGVQGGKYTELKKKTPFGDKHVVMGQGRLEIQATDATATDAATTEDSLQMEASWHDKAGNEYSVRCCKMLATHGVEFPTFGGVMTNHILHGSSRIGTALMPTEYTYLAFWGFGAVLKNGEVIDGKRLVHGMLTEYVRKSGYELAMDEEVTPTRRHFHLMVPPMEPVMDKGVFRHNDVHTGFSLPNGMELPFWHVMFGNLEISSQRG